jgi:predicted RNA-binding protein with PUA domain
VEKTISLSTKEYKDLKSYCDLNGLVEDEVLKSSYLQGFRIEKYGLLSSGGTVTEKEVIKYVDRPVEVIKEVEVLREVTVEIIKEVPTPPTEVKVVEYVDREVIREIPVEKIVEKIVNIYDNSEIDILLDKIKELENREPQIVEKEVIKEVIVQDNNRTEMLTATLQKLKQDLGEKNKKIEELEKIITNFESYKQNSGAAFLRGSNLNDTLYK